MIADRSLYLDRSRSRLVGETDPEVAWLLVWRGREIPADEVKRLGLVMHEGRVRQGEPVMHEPAALPEVEAADNTPPAAPEPESAPEPIMPPASRRSRRKY